jgi:ribonuclease R
VDQKSGALVDIRSGRSYNFGDLVTVKIAAVDLAKRQMELVIDSATSRAGGKAKKIPTGLQIGLGGGMSSSRSGGAGFSGLESGGKGGRTGGARRSQKSKARDKGKGNRFRDKK